MGGVNRYTVAGNVHSGQGKPRIPGKVLGNVTSAVRVAEGTRAGTVDVEKKLSEAKVDRLFSSGGYCFRGLGDFERVGDILILAKKRLGPWNATTGCKR